MINTVQNIDCLIGMQDIQDKSIDMILCDLPYGTTACKWDVIIPFVPLWKQYERIIKDNGAIVLTASQPFTSMLVMSNKKLFRYEWIWEKNYTPNFAATKKVPQKRHEQILVFYNKHPIYNEIRIPKNEASLSRCKYSFIPTKFNKENAYGKFGFQDKQQDVNYRNPTEQHPHSIVFFAKEDYEHPTQKPVALFEYLIKTYTNEGETVLDNCAGSGTTAIACINTNRNYILMEKEESYFNIIQERIKNHTVQLKLIA